MVLGLVLIVPPTPVVHEGGDAGGCARARGLLCLAIPGEGSLLPRDRMRAEVRPPSPPCVAPAAALGAAWG